MLVPMREQVNIFWNKQNRSQRITLVALAVAAAVIIPLLVMWATKPTYAVAYHGLSDADAGAIVQKLDEAKIPYVLQDGGTITVPSDQVYSARLKMANAGLPQNSTTGFELFSGTNTLGMTEFTQKVNYQRALEGELERTIQSLSAVQSVRVHVVQPAQTLLADQQQATTASVTLQPKMGQALDGSQVRAITHLVASSVEGLKAENVTIVDTSGNLLTVLPGSPDMGANQTDNQRAAEVAAAAEVKKRVQSMMDQVLGPNKYAVQASVLLDWNQTEVTSNVFDPTPAAIRSSHDVTEKYDTAGSVTGGVPGAGSNLPTPVATVTGGNGNMAYERTDNTVNYEISQTQTKQTIQPGQMKRISVSVLVDNVTDAAQLTSIKSAAAAAAGIDVARGDAIVVESVKFDHTYYDTQSAAQTQADDTNRYIQYGMAGGAVLLLIILLFLFLNALRKMRLGSVEAWQPVFKPVSELAAIEAGGPSAMPALAAQNAGAAYGLPSGQAAPSAQVTQALQAALQQQVAGGSGMINLSQEGFAPQKSDDEALAEIAARTANSAYPEDEQRARVVQRLTEENPATVAEIIQIWLSEDEHKNG